MALKLLQKEVDDLLLLLTKKNKYRSLLNSKVHIARYSASQLQTQLLEQTTRTQDYDDYRKGMGSYTEQGPKKTGDAYKGAKREQPFKRRVETLKKYTNAVLKEYKNLKYLQLGKTIQQGAYTYQLLSSDTDHVEFVIREGADPYTTFQNLNAVIHTNLIKGNKSYRKLFNLDEASDDKTIRKRVTDTQQIGHADGGGVVDKKALSSYALMTDESAIGDTSYTAPILLEDIKTGDGKTTYAEKIKDIFDITLTGEHVQKFRIKEGKFEDDFEVSVSVESEEANQNKSGRQSLQEQVNTGKTETKLGNELIALLRELQKDLEKEYSNPNTNAERKRSTSPLDIVEHMCLAGPNLQRLVRNKKVTKKAAAPFIKKAPKQGAPRKVTAHAQKIGKQPTFSKGLIGQKIKSKVGPSAGAKKRGVETGTSTQDALVARAFINSRLPQQVARNMGRPALENRSGRFAESVSIVSGTSTGSMSHFDYTYNPLYRVFEGGRDYTPNYDPRDLIEKSIRQLAAARIETKFTLRRV